MQSSTKVAAKDGEAALPSWFTPQRFLDNEFDAEAYVADLRRFVSFAGHCQSLILQFHPISNYLQLAHLLRSIPAGTPRVC